MKGREGEEDERKGKGRKAIREEERKRGREEERKRKLSTRARPNKLTMQEFKTKDT